jgi:hypothetical protein
MDNYVGPRAAILYLYGKTFCVGIETPSGERDKKRSLSAMSWPFSLPFLPGGSTRGCLEVRRQLNCNSVAEGSRLGVVLMFSGSTVSLVALLNVLAPPFPIIHPHKEAGRR